MCIIDKLKNLIPPLLIYRKKIYLAKTENVKLPLGRRVFIFLAANYGNLGDIAITYAQHKWLENYFKDRSIVEVPANCTFSYLKGFLTKVEKDDIITFVGGGNMGDMYPLYENIRQLIVSMLPENMIIQFPLTTDFSTTYRGRLMKMSAKYVYGSHKNMTILSREKKSEKFLLSLLKKDIKTVPDMVLTLDYLNVASENRKNAALCLRQDNEKLLSESVVSSITKVLNDKFSHVEHTDTLIDDACINLSNKELYLYNFLQDLSKKQLLVTDRLHGMIFAYITGTPAIVFSNSNQKVKYCYDWIKDCGYVFYMDQYSEQDFIDNITKVLTCHVDRNLFQAKRNMFNNMIKDVI